MLKSDLQNGKKTPGKLFSPNLSTIERTHKKTRLESDGDLAGPLHSTALGEDLIPAETASGQRGGQIPMGATPRRPTEAQAKGAIAKRPTEAQAKGAIAKRPTESDTHAMGPTPKRPTNAQAKSRNGQPAPSKALAPGEKLRSSVGAKPKARPVPISEGEEDAPTPAPDAPTPAPDAPSPAHRRPELSSEELSDGENSWVPAPKIKRKYSGATRKSAGDGLSSRKSAGDGLSSRKSAGDGLSSRKSSDSGDRPSNRKSAGDRLSNRKSAGDRPSNRKSAGDRLSNRKSAGDRLSSEDRRRNSSESSESESSDATAAVSRPKQQQRKGKTNPTDQDVVLDHFLEMTSLYSEKLESRAVRKAIDAFSISMQDKLTEKISETQELNHLKRENAKASAAINKRRKSLIDAKNEAISTGRELRAQQKERDGLKRRLADLREGSAFLAGLAHLHRSPATQLLQNSKHTYGASSLPAMLLEVQGGLQTDEELEAVVNILKQTV